MYVGISLEFMNCSSLHSLSSDCNSEGAIILGNLEASLTTSVVEVELMVSGLRNIHNNLGIFNDCMHGMHTIIKKT